MPGLCRRSWLWLALLAWLLAARQAPAPYLITSINTEPLTLTDEVKQASLVVVGRLTNLDPTPRKDAPGGTTDLVIEVVLKNHDWLNNRKVLTLPRVISFTKGKDDRMLVFCDFFKGKLDPYRGAKASTELVRYVKGLVELKDENLEKQLRFCFDHLDNADATVAEDACKEFGAAGYEKYRVLAARLPAERIIKALVQPNLPAERLGLYAVLLGRCGKPEHAGLLGQLLSDKEKQKGGVAAGLMIGYTLLQGKEGWDQVRRIMNDPSRDVMARYAALRTARFFWEQRGEVAIDKKAIAEAVAGLLDQKDIADIAIEDFRRWHYWDVADRVVALQVKEEIYSIPINRRAIMRYALCARDNASAKCYIAEQRKKDPELVKDTEELLKLEENPSTPK